MPSLSLFNLHFTLITIFDNHLWSKKKARQILPCFFQWWQILLWPSLASLMSVLCRGTTADIGLPPATAAWSSAGGWLSDRGRIAGSYIFHLVFSWEMSRLDSLLSCFIWDLQLEWGWREPCKGNYNAVYTTSFTSMESVQVSFLGVFPSELESSSFHLMSAFWLIQLFWPLLELE